MRVCTGFPFAEMMTSPGFTKPVACEPEVTATTRTPPARIGTR